jgi:uncharacterized membrane protein (DUF485 family)
MKQPNMERTSQILESPEFKHLVATRWRFSLTMTFVMLAVYFGFIFAVGFGKETLSVKLGDHVNLGLALGVAVIVFAWLMTGIYVRWANRKYDAKVKQLVKRLHESAPNSAL